MPPDPPDKRSKQGSGNDPAISKNGSVKKGERHPKAAEEGETANIQHNTTNNGFFFAAGGWADPITRWRPRCGSLAAKACRRLFSHSMIEPTFTDEIPHSGLSYAREKDGGPNVGEMGRKTR
jgi:hypothetical protein